MAPSEAMSSLSARRLANRAEPMRSTIGGITRTAGGPMERDEKGRWRRIHGRERPVETEQGWCQLVTPGGLRRLACGVHAVCRGFELERIAVFLICRL